MSSKNTDRTPFVSIIVPLHVVCKRFYSDLRKFDALSYPHYELIVVTDRAIKIPNIKNVRVLMTGRRRTGPAEKRDIALKHSKGSICAFIDDDAYPDQNWITKAVRHFVRNKDTVAIGGPGITPPDDTRMAMLGGLVYESDYTSGGLKMRFASIGERPRETLDWPAFNLFVRTNIIKKAGGWGSTYYGGEDTFLCLKMIAFGRMFYDPKIVVYHHRRPLFIPHLRQIFNVGMHRGYFFKHYPETSRQFIYFVPTLLTVGFWILFGLSFVSTVVACIFFLLFGVFFGMAFSTVSMRTDMAGAVIASFGIIATHMAYGIGFLKGIMIGDLKH